MDFNNEVVIDAALAAPSAVVTADVTITITVTFDGPAATNASENGLGVLDDLVLEAVQSHQRRDVAALVPRATCFRLGRSGCCLAGDPQRGGRPCRPRSSVPRLAGATPYTVLTGSMQPELAPFTLVVVKPVLAERVNVIAFPVRAVRQVGCGHPPTDPRYRPTSRARPPSPPRATPTTSPMGCPSDRSRIKGRLWYSGAAPCPRPP